MTKELAIMTNVTFGTRDDVSFAALWFFVKLVTGDGALICIKPAVAVDLLEKHHINDVHMLEGKPCIVEVDKAKDTVVFVELFKP